MGRLRTRHFLGGLLLAAVAALAAGCARARVQNVQADRTVAVPRPGRIVVFDFDTGPADVRVGTSPRRTARQAVGLYVSDSDTLAQAVANALAHQMVEDLRGRGFTAERAANALPPQPNDLVIQGQFLRVNEGSQVGRFVIGLGVGATQLRTQVEIFHVTPGGWRPIKQFDTVADGARFPGAAFFVASGAAGGTVATSAIIASGGGVVREVFASIDADARRTSEQIARALSDLATAQRW
jgi:Domain of unknown function (DUF4410)